MKDEYISVEHIMLGIIERASGGIRQLLKRHGIDTDSFLKALPPSAEARGLRATCPRTRMTRSTNTSDLVELARNKKLDPVIGRDGEIRNVVRILSRKTKTIRC